MPVEQLTFTVLRPGEGYNRSLNGYQIKGCSRGLTPEERDLVSEICVHYGGPVYTDAPRSAQDRVKAWVDERRSCELPDEILEHFPCAWSYVQLGDDRVALTCVRYVGFTKEPRPGNFFGHSLVFSPSILKSVNSNPLEFSRQGWIQSRDISDRGDLDAFDEADLRTPGAPSDCQILRQEQYSRQLSPMLCALANASQSGRPVVLCIANWQEAFPLVDALLSVLPPAARRRTAFCTYENDLNWKPSSRAGRTTPSQPPPYSLLIQCAVDGRSPRLSPNHYQTHAVFNFLENCDKAPRDVSVYSNFAADAVANGTSGRIINHHALAERLGCDGAVDAWNILVSAASLAESSALRTDELFGAVKALVRVASGPAEAQVAMEYALPHIKRLAESRDMAGLSVLAPELATLADRLTVDDASFQSSLSSLASSAFVNGSGSIADALLKACGRRRQQVLQDLVKTPPASTSKDDADRSAIVDLLLEGLKHANSRTGELVLSLFTAGRSVGRTTELWKIIGETVVVSMLDGDWTAEKRDFARHLIDSVSGDCPDGELKLRRIWIAHSGLKGEETVQEVLGLARVAARCPDAEGLGAEILQLVREKLAEGKAKGELCEILGRFSAATEDTSCHELFFSAYKKEIAEIVHPNKRFEVRKRLAGQGALRLVSGEFLAAVLPWDEAESRKTLKEWDERLLQSTPGLMDDVLNHVEQRFGSDAHELAEYFLSKRSGSASSAFARLYGTAVMDLPLEHPSEKWLNPVPATVREEVKDRVSILNFLARVLTLSEKSNWSIEEFYKAASTDSTWAKVRLLREADKERILNGCVDTFATVGITTTDEASRFADMMGAIDVAPEKMAAAIWRLVENRDEVTQVNVAKAFAQNYLDRRSGARWTEIVEALANRFERSTRRLLEANLEKGFGKRGSDFEKRLQDLCATVGLGKPRPAEPSKVEMAAPGGQTVTDKLGKITSKIFGKLMGGSEPTNKA